MMNNENGTPKNHLTPEHIQLWSDTANVFFEVGKYCDERDSSFQSSPLQFKRDAFYAIPAIVNLALACELYLKKLLVQCGHSNTLKTHNLLKLFEGLPEHVRKKASENYKRETPYKRVTLSDTLRIHSNSFENWRYIYETNNQSSEAYIENLLLAVQILKNLYPD